MKNLNHFEAFKLNKRQMNAIAGGAKCSIHILSDQTTLDGTYPSSMTKDEAYAAIHAKYDDIYGAGNVVVVC